MVGSRQLDRIPSVFNGRSRLVQRFWLHRPISQTAILLGVHYTEHVAMARTKERINKFYPQNKEPTPSSFLIDTHTNLDTVLVGQHHGPRMGFTATRSLGSNLGQNGVWWRGFADRNLEDCDSTILVESIESLDWELFVWDFKYFKIAQPTAKIVVLSCGRIALGE